MHWKNSTKAKKTKQIQTNNNINNRGKTQHHHHYTLVTMVKNTLYKKQKLSSRNRIINQEVPLFPPTKYEKSKATLKHFPSSIVNGVTAEGGLYSLTFKSINCASFVENNELMKTVFKVPKLELSKVTDNDDVDKLKNWKQTLENDINELKKSDSNVANTNIVSDLQNELQTDLENNGNNLATFGEKLADSFVVNINISDGNYKVIQDVIIPGLQVDTFEDVTNPDLSEYEKITLSDTQNEEKEETGNKQETEVGQEVESEQKDENKTEQTSQPTST